MPVAGVGVAALVSKSQKAATSLVTLGFGAFIGLMAWFGYGLWGEAEGLVGTFVSETLAATAIGGMAALPIALFPVRGMSGGTIFAWSRSWWAACYAAGLAGFFLVLMPTPYAWKQTDWGLRAWILGYLTYFVVALVLWLLIRRGSPAEPDEPIEPAPPPEPAEQPAGV